MVDRYVERLADDPVLWGRVSDLIRRVPRELLADEDVRGAFGEYVADPGSYLTRVLRAFGLVEEGNDGANDDRS